MRTFACDKRCGSNIVPFINSMYWWMRVRAKAPRVCVALDLWVLGRNSKKHLVHIAFRSYSIAEKVKFVEINGLQLALSQRATETNHFAEYAHNTMDSIKVWCTRPIPFNCRIVLSTLNSSDRQQKQTKNLRSNCGADKKRVHFHNLKLFFVWCICVRVSWMLVLGGGEEGGAWCSVGVCLSAVLCCSCSLLLLRN